MRNKIAKLDCIRSNDIRSITALSLIRRIVKRKNAEELSCEMPSCSDTTKKNNYSPKILFLKPSLRQAVPSLKSVPNYSKRLIFVGVVMFIALTLWVCVVCF